MPVSEDRLLPVPEVAKRLALAESTIWLYIGQGTIPSVKVGRARRVRESDLEHFIASLSSQAAVAP